MRCEYCRTKVIGEYIIKDKNKISKFFEGTKIMPCCKAEVCEECFKIISKTNKCPFCGGKL